ncbi:MAG: hypothetical protein ACT6FG_05730 [Methanosarcinaceae archaeon]
MVLPLIPIAIGTGIAGLGLGFGASKKGGMIAGVQHAPYETVHTTSTDARAFNITMPDTNVIYDSPLSKIETKKTLSAEASPDISGPVSGTDMSQIAIIGAVALVGYGLVSKKR